MNKTTNPSFEKNWVKFSNRLQGQMLIESRQQHITLAIAKMLLADQKEFWDSCKKEGGCWLDAYEAEQPQKAAMVRQILLQDMAFTQEYTPKNGGSLIKYLLPVVGAAVGFSVSQAMGATAVLKTISSIALGAVSYPVATGLSSSAEDQNEKKMVKFYMDQLEKYRISVSEIL